MSTNLVNLACVGFQTGAREIDKRRMATSYAASCGKVALNDRQTRACRCCMQRKFWRNV